MTRKTDIEYIVSSLNLEIRRIKKGKWTRYLIKTVHFEGTVDVKRK